MSRVVKPLIASFAVLSLLPGIALADVVPGDTIDKTNFHKIEGLVPDYILTWVKNGDLTMKIGKVNFDPKRFWSPEVLENWDSNVGRYKIDENNGIIDTKTGKPARGVKGLPFPEPDTNDPKAPVQILWNRQFVEYFLQGNTHAQFYWLPIGRGGLEKSIAMENLTMVLDPSKAEEDFAQLAVFREPFSLAGTGTLALYGLYPLAPGVRFAYAPELRRLKRMSPRLTGSDTHFGLDGAPDDTWSGGPKTNIDEGTYRFLGEKDALIPRFSEDPLVVTPNEKGEVDVGLPGTGKEFTIGFQDPNWKGAPWHVTNIIWVKTKIYALESRGKDSNYAYGPCEGWVEKGSFSNSYKRITDSAGNLWKGSYWPAVSIGTADGKFRINDNSGQVVVDMKRDHGSAYPEPFWKGGYRKVLVKDMDESQFTEGGFIRFNK